MTVTITDIRTQYPEFTNADNALLQAHLDAALVVLDESAFGDLYDQAVIEYTCMSVADSAYGRPMALSKDAYPETNHSRKFARLQAMATCIPAGILWGS